MQFSLSYADPVLGPDKNVGYEKKLVVIDADTRQDAWTTLANFEKLGGIVIHFKHYARKILELAPCKVAALN